MPGMPFFVSTLETEVLTADVPDVDPFIWSTVLALRSVPYLSILTPRDKPQRLGGLMMPLDISHLKPEDK